MDEDGIISALSEIAERIEASASEAKQRDETIIEILRKIAFGVSSLNTLLQEAETTRSGIKDDLAELRERLAPPSDEARGWPD